MAALSIEQIAKNRERLRQEIEHRKELLKAYDLVENDLRQSVDAVTNGATPITARHRSRVTTLPAYGHITRIVRDAISEMCKPFTIRDIHSNIGGDDMNISVESVTNVVNRLREESPPVIRVRHPGKGRRATIFEKA